MCVRARRGRVAQLVACVTQEPGSIPDPATYFRFLSARRAVISYLAKVYALSAGEPLSRAQPAQE